MCPGHTEIRAVVFAVSEKQIYTPVQCTAECCAWREKLYTSGTFLFLPGCFTGEFPQWCQVIQNPEGASVCADDQIILLNFHVVNRNNRKVTAKFLPVFSGIGAHKNSGFRTDEQQSRTSWIFADYPADFSFRIVTVDAAPFLTAVCRFV